MDRSRCRAIVDRYLRSLRSAMQLGDWTFHLHYGPISDPRASAAEGESTAGRCHVRANYREADIHINDAVLHSEAEVLKTLRHEMLHVLHARLHLYREQAETSVSDVGCAALSKSWGFGVEDLVLCIERMLDDGLGLTPVKLARRADAYLRTQFGRRWEGSGPNGRTKGANNRKQSRARNVAGGLRPVPPAQRVRDGAKGAPGGVRGADRARAKGRGRPKA